jgi:hypothetical protein
VEFAREHGIAVHHCPRFPLLGPDHRKYQLTPIPHGHHSSHTTTETRRGVRAAWKDATPPEGELFSVLDLRQPPRFDLESW